MTHRQYVPRFPALYETWQDHDLNSSHGEFYRGPAPQEEIRIWSGIETQYLQKYRGFYRVWFDWGSDGLWAIPFPGSLSAGSAVDLVNFDVSAEARERLLKWHRGVEDNYEPWDKSNVFDWEASDREGLEAAKLLRRELPKDIYLEFGRFRELVLQGQDVVELPFPSFLFAGSEP